MKKPSAHYAILVSVLLSIILSSCEQDVTDATLPYQEKIVLYGYLRSFQDTQRISVRRTIPPLEQPKSSSNYVLPNAEVILTTPDGEKLRFRYDSTEGNYFLPAQLKSNSTYKLDVSAIGKRASVTTTIPPDQEMIQKFEDVVSANSGDTTYYRLWGLRATPNINFTAEEYISYSDSLFIDEREYKTQHQSPIDYGYWYGTFVLDTQSSPWFNSGMLGRNGFIRDKVFVLVTSYFYDEALNQYLNSLVSGDDFDVFGSSGTNPRFNVQGDGIGCVVGSSRVQRVYSVTRRK